jgi:hypothetical protein
MADDSQRQKVIEHARNDMAALPPERAGTTQTTVTPKPTGKKIGEGHVKKMWELGKSELAQALTGLPDSNIRPMEPPVTSDHANAPQHDPQPSSSYGAALDDTAQQSPSEGRGRSR